MQCEWHIVVLLRQDTDQHSLWVSASEAGVMGTPCKYTQFTGFQHHWWLSAATTRRPVPQRVWCMSVAHRYDHTAPAHALLFGRPSTHASTAPQCASRIDFDHRWGIEEWQFSSLWDWDCDPLSVCVTRVVGLYSYLLTYLLTYWKHAVVIYLLI